MIAPWLSATEPRTVLFEACGQTGVARANANRKTTPRRKQVIDEAPLHKVGWLILSWFGAVYSDLKEGAIGRIDSSKIYSKLNHCLIQKSIPNFWPRGVKKWLGGQRMKNTMKERATATKMFTTRY